MTNNAATNILLISGSLIGITLLINSYMNEQQRQQKAKEQPKSTPVWDAISENRLKGLHPKFEPQMRELINRAESELGIRLRLTHGTRTFAEQDKLYAQGRTTPGKIVTNAQAGQSLHNYGLAGDVVPIVAGLAVWNNNDHWNKVGILGESIGMRWGGRFTSLVDKPHFENRFGYTTTQLLAMINNGQTTNGFVNV